MRGHRIVALHAAGRGTGGGNSHLRPRADESFQPQSWDAREQVEAGHGRYAASVAADDAKPQRST